MTTTPMTPTAPTLRCLCGTNLPIRDLRKGCPTCGRHWGLSKDGQVWLRRERADHKL